MLRVIINVKRKEDPADFDLEVSAESRIDEFSDLIAQKLGWYSQENAQYSIYVPSLNRYISLHETLAEAGIWDGSRLEFVPTPVTAPIKDNGSSNSLIIRTTSGNTYALTKSPSILGRKTSSTVNVIDLGGENKGKSISRQHARIEKDNEYWLITPLHGKHNRTLINGEVVPIGTRKRICPGDVIVLGAVELEVGTADAATD